MLKEIQRRNFTQSTCAYITHLFRDKKLSGNSADQTVGALRFFFVKILKRLWRVDENAVPEQENAFARDSKPG